MLFAYRVPRVGIMNMDQVGKRPPSIQSFTKPSPPLPTFVVLERSLYDLKTRPQVKTTRKDVDSEALVQRFKMN